MIPNGNRIWNAIHLRPNVSALEVVVASDLRYREDAARWCVAPLRDIYGALGKPRRKSIDE